MKPSSLSQKTHNFSFGATSVVSHLFLRFTIFKTKVKIRCLVTPTPIRRLCQVSSCVLLCVLSIATPGPLRVACAFWVLRCLCLCDIFTVWLFISIRLFVAIEKGVFFFTRDKGQHLLEVTWARWSSFSASKQSENKNSPVRHQMQHLTEAALSRTVPSECRSFMQKIIDSESSYLGWRERERERERGDNFYV